MQPAHSGDDGSSSANLKKWGPIVGIVLVVGAVVGLVVATGGDDDDTTDTTATDTSATETTATDVEPEATDPDGEEPEGTEPEATEPDSTEPEATEPEATEPDQPSGDITYPLSFAEAEEQGVAVEWGERCDTELGTVAMKWYFAPGCYAPFEGDNGGATATGVTADSIKVVQYLGPDDDPIISYLTDAIAVDDSNDDAEATLRSMLDMFSSYYEFYGRSIDYETYVSSGIANDEVTARADAVRIAEDFEPFAVLGGPALTNAFADELAARGIVCIGCTPGQPQAWYADRAPYVYGLAIGAAQARDHGREFISKRLIGGNASFAGDEAYQGQPRTFGHVYLSSSPESPALADDFVSGLTADGADVVEVLPYTLDPGSIQQQASQIVAKLKSSAVTTVVIAGDGVAPRDITREATAQEYFPEWVLVAPALSDLTAFGRTYDQSQWANAFGVTHGAVPVTPEESGYFALYRWWTGEEPPAADTIGVLIPNMALLVSGIQQTGPDLTPENMSAALFDGPTTTPGITEPFLSYGERGYWDGVDFSGVDDAALIWWDESAEGPDEIRKDGTGMYVFVDGGTRYLPGEWPAESALFDPAGGITIYEVAPAEETPPDYPSPAG